jgi:hypothetical protein
MNAQVRMPAQIDGDARQLAARADVIQHDAEVYVCEDREQFAIGAEQVRTIVDIEKRLEAKRKSVTVPLNAVLDEINSWFKAPAAALLKAKRSIELTMGKFKQIEDKRIEDERREKDRIAREEREEFERRAAKAAERGQEGKAQELLAKADAVVPELPDTAPVRARGMSFGEHWEFRIVKPELLPREYLQADESKIGQLVRALKNKEQAEKLLAGAVEVFSRPKIGARGSR